MLLSLINITVIDIIDILIVAFLLYKFYQLIKGTAAIKVFFIVALIYLFWLLFRALNMELISSIIGQIFAVGVIAMIIVFQQEVRQFILMISDKYTKHGAFFNKLKQINNFSDSSIDAIVQACSEMSETSTGALIVLARETSLQTIIETGELVNSEINTQLIKAIFYKNAPLHDGAMIIERNRIVAAKCILPVSQKTNLPNDYGLRHRSGLGLSEISDALIIIVSEQSGHVSIAYNSRIQRIPNENDLKKEIVSYLKNERPEQ